MLTACYDNYSLLMEEQSIVENSIPSNRFSVNRPAKICHEFFSLARAYTVPAAGTISRSAKSSDTVANW